MSDQASGSKNGSLANNCSIENDRSDADQRLIFNRTRMKTYLMTDCNVITDYTAAVRFHMNQRKVLNVGIFSDFNLMNVAAENCTGPNAGVIPD